MNTQKNRPENGFPDHLTADAWDHDLHAYQTRHMKQYITPDTRADMEPAPEPEPMTFQCDRCGNTTRPRTWHNGETLCSGQGGCSAPPDYLDDDEDPSLLPQPDY